MALAPEQAQKYAALAPHRLATLIMGKREVNGDESRPAMKDKARASVLSAASDGMQCAVRLRRDAIEAYAKARSSAADKDGKVPDTFRAPGFLEPITHLLERLATEGKVSLTVKRSIVRQGRDGQTSRMSVEAVELEPGGVAVFGLRTAIKMLSRYRMLLEPVAMPSAKVYRAEELEPEGEQAEDDDSDLDALEAEVEGATEKKGPKQRKRPT